MRHIELVTRVRVESAVEEYEARLELSTTTGKRMACFDEALALREAVLATLKNCGFADADIREAGGEALQNVWLTTKSVVHRIAIRNERMEMLMSAMAAIERHFSQLKQPFFSKIKQNFVFHPPIPIYANNGTADDGLRQALRDAHRTASLIANETGCQLGQVLFVAELPTSRRASPYSPLQSAELEQTNVDFCHSENDSLGSISYTGLPTASGNAAHSFRIRFAVEDTAPTHQAQPQLIK